MATRVMIRNLMRWTAPTSGTYVPNLGVARLAANVRNLRTPGAEHDVEVRHRQQLGLAHRQPRAGRALALGAMPVAAGVVGDVLMGALFAACDVAAECARVSTESGQVHRLTFAAII